MLDRPVTVCFDPQTLWLFVVQLTRRPGRGLSEQRPWGTARPVPGHASPGGIPVPQLQQCEEGRRSLLVSREPVEVGGLMTPRAVAVCESSLRAVRLWPCQ